tara:strand:+ start:14951 stop:15103 length:153 start_codon:yes stop_codon:yes gene_type:complete
MFYTYCITFHINPIEAYNTPFALVKQMLEIHGEFKKLEADEMNKHTRKVK